MRGKIRDITNYLWQMVSSKYFFVFILVITLFQGVWYATSLKPWIYDEARHFANIQIYAGHLSPFFSHQDQSWDHLGEVIRDGSYLFYYLMSWPLRLIQFFTNDQMVQYVGLRFICIAIFAFAVIVFRKALLETSQFSRGIVHLSLLFFILTPAAGLLAGIINYDNLVFLLFSVILLLSIRFVKDCLNTGRINVGLLIEITILSLIISVVKWTSIALIAPIFIYICWVMFQKNKGRTFRKIWHGFQSIKRSKRILLVGLLLISTALFIERPVENVLAYGSPEPSCSRVIGNQRCQSFKDYVSYQKVEQSKSSTFQPVNPIAYATNYWIPTMAKTMTNLLEQESSQLPIVVALYYLLFFASIVILLITLRDLSKSKMLVFLLMIVVVYITALIGQEYTSYLHYGGPVAIRARYLVPILPIYLALCLVSIRILYAKHMTILALLTGVVLLSLSQGGSIVTHLFTVPPSAYWNNRTFEINNSAKNALSHFVKE